MANIEGEYYEYAFDSSDAQASNAANTSSKDWPLFTFSQPIIGLVGFKVMELQVPFSYYIINTTNNTFTFTESAGGTTTITVPVGNYSALSISTTLTSLLTAASVTNGNSFVYTTSYDSSAAKLLITRTAGSGTFTLTFGATDDLGITNPRLWLGFNAGANTSTLGNLQAPNTIDITGPIFLYLNSSVFGRLVDFTLPIGVSKLGNGSVGPQIAKIPVNTNPNGLISWADQSVVRYFESINQNVNTNITQADFYLTLGSSTVKPLALNGQSFSFRLALVVNEIGAANIINRQVGQTNKRIRV